MNITVTNYSLVAYLGGEEYKKVRRIQKNLQEITGSKKCLEDWLPHITLGDGIAVTREEISRVESEIKRWSEKQKVTKSKVTGFGGIENWKGAVEGKITPYVIWLDVEVSPGLLQLYNTLRDEITAHHNTWLPRTTTYTPHITLAFSDLTKEGYEAGMKFLSDQQEETVLDFSISHIALVECYGEGNMTSIEYKKFYFVG